MPEEQQQQQQGSGGSGTLNFDTWLGQQDGAIQTLISEHISGLKTALQSEREQRRGFERELREAARQAEEGSTARQQLDRLGESLALTERQAAFYEAAHGAGITNLKLAWLAVQQDEGLQDRAGNVNLDSLKEKYPELFATQRPQTPAGNAGSGTGGSPPAAGQSMDDWIRRRAGVPTQ